MAAEFALPQALTRFLADAEVEVVSWSAKQERLVLQIAKEIGPETALLTLTGVSHVNLPSRLTIERIECGGLDLLPDGYLDAFRPGDCSLDPSERVFMLYGSWGPTYYVVAEAATYEVDA